VWTALFALALPLGLGLACARGRWLESPTLSDGQLVAALNRFALLVAFPALVVASWIDPIRPTRLEPGLALAAILGLAGGVAIALVVGRRSGPSRDGGDSRDAGVPSRGALALIALFGNSAYLGLPLVTALIGPDILRRASFVVAIPVAASVTAGSYLLAREGSRTVTSRELAGVLAASPLAWSPLLGAALALSLAHLDLSSHPFTEASFGALHALGRTASPLGLFVLGLYLGAPRSSGTLSNPTARADVAFVAIRLFVVPACTLAAGLALRAAGLLDDEGVRLVVLLSAMPAAISTFAMAHERGVEPERVARAIVTTTLVSALTVPAWLWLTGRALGE